MNTKKNKFLKPCTDKDGYLRVNLYREGGKMFKPIRRLVAVAHIKNPLNLPQVIHKKGIKTDNRASELQWRYNKYTMNKFQPHIIPIYPPHNELIFEEWVTENYQGCNTDRELLPVHFTSYWVNNDYGNNQQARKELNDFLGTLDKSKKYFAIIQYDDGSMIDWRLFGLDVLEFNMSKRIGIELPLLCQPHPYKFKGGKKWLASFVGSRTHPIRNELEKFKNRDGWFISYEPTDIETYCRIMHESIFTLCPRGYGINSFRIAEAMQYGSIPVYISDDYVHPFEVKFNDYGVALNSRHIEFLAEELEKIEPEEIVRKQENIQKYYDEYYTYQGCLNNIIIALEFEFNNRQQVRTIPPTNGAVENTGDYIF